MHNKEKIILMAKLAVYDKNIGKEDWKDDVFFRQDFIYSSNMKTRFYIFFGCIILTVFYFLHRSSFHDINLFTIDYLTEARNLLIFFAIVLVTYTVIGTIIYTARYVQMQKRIMQYFELLDKLDDINEQEAASTPQSEDFS